MVDGGPATLPHGDVPGGDGVGGRLEHRRVHHPQEAPGVLVDQADPMADLQPGGTEQLLGGLPVAGGEEDRVARLGVHRRCDPCPLSVGDVLGDRSTQFAVLADGDVGQPAGAALLGPLLPGVELPARQRSAAGHHDTADVGGLEDPERGVGEELCEFADLQVEAQVRLVRAVVVHGVVPGHPGQRQLHLHPDELPARRHHLFGQGDHVVLVDEAHLDVELGELRLPVGAEVLVAVAAGDLVVPLHPGDHQQLLEQLRALRQRVPLARVQPGGHHEVTRTLRGGAGQRRGLDVVEVVFGHHLVDDLGDLRAQHHRVVLARPAQVQVAVLQPRVLAHPRALVDLEGQRRGGIEHLKGADRDLHLAGGDVGVDVLGGAGVDHSGDLDAELVAQVVDPGRGEVLIANHHLADPGGVTQVDEGDPAMVAALGHPAGEGDGLPDVLDTEGAGTVGAQHGSSFLCPA